MKNWKYYNYAAISTRAPHEDVDISPLNDGSIWKIDGKPLLARWTTDFDCGCKTNWWYVIKDEQFDLMGIPSKKRYEINKGKKNFDIQLIDPQKYINEIYEVTLAAFSSWPEKYRPILNEKKFKAGILAWKEKRVFAAFEKENGCLAGYAYLTEYSGYVDFNVLRVKPELERKGINAAIVNGILEFYNEKISSSFYILDGARNINHETAFQDYLIKYFRFRRAYCRLHIRYKFKVLLVVKCLYPFRSILVRFDSKSCIHKVNVLLKMEEIVRNSNE